MIFNTVYMQSKTVMSQDLPTRHQTKKGNSRIIGLVAVIASLLIVIGAAGVLSHGAGYGAFGYRLLFYGDGSLYVLNLSENDRFVSVDGRPLKAVDADGAELLRLVGGTSSIEIFDENEHSLQRLSVETDHSHAFLNLSNETCLVVSELSNITTDEPLAVEIVDILGSSTDIYNMSTNNVVWPRGYPGVLTDDGPPARSIEAIDCWLLEEEEFLRDYLQSRFSERLAPRAAPI